MIDKQALNKRSVEFKERDAHRSSRSHGTHLKYSISTAHAPYTKKNHIISY